MRRVTLQLRVHGEPRQRIWLRQGQVVEAGGSDAVDISIPDDPQLAAIHLTIAHQTMGCFCECLAAGGTLWINGQLATRKRLKHLDLLGFGSCELEICIEEDSPPGPAWHEGDDRLPAFSPAPTPAQLPATPPATPLGWGSAPVLPAASPPASTSLGSSPIVIAAEYIPPGVPALSSPTSLRHVDSTTASDGDDDLSLESTGRSAPAEPHDRNPPGHEYASEKLAGEIWRYHPAPTAALDLETVVGRLAELFDIFLVVLPSTAARLASQRLLPDRLTEINVNMSLIENPDLPATLTLLQGEASRHEVMLIASRSGLQELSASLQQHAFTFGRPSIFTMQVSVAHQSLLDQFMFGKVAVLTTESGGWDLYSMVNPSEEHQFLGFDRPPSLMF